MKANESAQIKVELSGEGNLKLVKLPGISTPNGLEVYEPEHKENIRTTVNGLSGSVYDQYAVVPQSRGKFKIPGVSFSYFNPKEEKYYSVETEPIMLNALQGRDISDETVVSSRQEVIINEGDIRYIQLKTYLLSVGCRNSETLNY